MKVSIERSKVMNRGAMIAFVDVCVDDTFIIKGCKVMASNNGRFVSMPSQKEERDGQVKYYDHVVFKSRELKDQFGRLVISAYDGNSGEEPKGAPEGAEEPQKGPAGPKGAINWDE